MSKDSTAVGSAIIRDRRSIATGYNGFASKIADVPERFTKTGEITKYDYTVHAEANAILQCAKYGQSTDGAMLVCTLSPCVECAKSIIQAGITDVLFKEDPNFVNEGWRAKVKLSLQLFDEAGVNYYIFDQNLQLKLTSANDAYVPMVGNWYTRDKHVFYGFSDGDDRFFMTNCKRPYGQHPISEQRRISLELEDLLKYQNSSNDNYWEIFHGESARCVAYVLPQRVVDGPNRPLKLFINSDSGWLDRYVSGYYRQDAAFETTFGTDMREDHGYRIFHHCNLEWIQKTITESYRNSKVIGL